MRASDGLGGDIIHEAFAVYTLDATCFWASSFCEGFVGVDPGVVGLLEYDSDEAVRACDVESVSLFGVCEEFSDVWQSGIERGPFIEPSRIEVLELRSPIGFYVVGNVCEVGFLPEVAGCFFCQVEDGKSPLSLSQDDVASSVHRFQG